MRNIVLHFIYINKVFHFIFVSNVSVKVYFYFIFRWDVVLTCIPHETINFNNNMYYFNNLIL